MRLDSNNHCSLFSRNVDTMDLFMLPRDIRCRVLSLLLGAVKIERDQYIVSHEEHDQCNQFITCSFVQSY